MESFLDAPERKYQRRRASHDDLLLAKRMLANLPG
jgi:hypothetical protein